MTQPQATTRATPADVALLRLAAQRLVGPRCATAGEAVRWMGALQAQDERSARTAVALRTAGGTSAAVVAAMDAGEVVRSWPMRGTLHLVPAEDLGWMLALTTDRLVTGAASRRAALGLEPQHLERAQQVAVEAMSGGRRLLRAELVALWEDAGLLGAPQRGYHLLWHLAQTGVVVFGPTRDGEAELVLLAEWVARPRALEREESLGEWALRYFRSHGPATAKDLAWWTGLRAADVRAGVALAAPHLEQVDVDGAVHLVDPAARERLAAARAEAEGVHLLPAFDEHLLGYGDRSAVLARAHSPLVVPGGNGVFRATVVDAGQVVGTWKRGRGRAGAPGEVEAAPFTAFSPAVEAALPALAARLP